MRNRFNMLQKLLVAQKSIIQNLKKFGSTIILCIAVKFCLKHINQINILSQHFYF